MYQKINLTMVMTGNPHISQAQADFINKIEQGLTNPRLVEKALIEQALMKHMLIEQRLTDQGLPEREIYENNN